MATDAGRIAAHMGVWARRTGAGVTEGVAPWEGFS
jgi:hypothetical protein